jgi:choice-of-anchor B domain-containing protein
MSKFIIAFAFSIIAAVLAGCGGGSSTPTPPAPPPPPPPPGMSTGPADCISGTAADFSCSGISLLARVPLGDMDGTEGNDIWAWHDQTTGLEYAIVGMTNGTAFVDISDPVDPAFLGRLPTQTVSSTWRDIKVYQDHAYIVADNADAHGMQVFDLTRLRGVSAPQDWIPDDTYTDFGNAHNLAINEESGFAYAVGTNTCGGGLHMIDITTPNNPLFAGCHASGDTHDTQCVIYAGPDVAHQGSEICASSNADHVEIADVSVKSSPVTLSTLTYAQLGFVHQGWLTEDHRFLLIGDELDEGNFGVNTRTHVIDVSDLDNPAYVYAYEAATASIDHNLYVLGNRVYQANYTSGLRVLEFMDLASQQMSEIAFFDTFPDSDATSFDGAWSVYPYLPSGNLVVNDRANGLFVLALQ